MPPTPSRADEVMPGSQRDVVVSRARRAAPSSRSALARNLAERDAQHNSRHRLDRVGALCHEIKQVAVRLRPTKVARARIETHAPEQQAWGPKQSALSAGSPAGRAGFRRQRVRSSESPRSRMLGPERGFGSRGRFLKPVQRLNLVPSSLYHCWHFRACPSVTRKFRNRVRGTLLRALLL
jgi:hypothetical protein